MLENPFIICTAFYLKLQCYFYKFHDILILVLGEIMKNILIHRLGQNSPRWNHTSAYSKETHIGVICLHFIMITKKLSKIIKCKILILSEIQ